MHLVNRCVYPEWISPNTRSWVRPSACCSIWAAGVTGMCKCLVKQNLLDHTSGCSSVESELNWVVFIDYIQVRGLNNIHMAGSDN